ncbi:cell division protein FtsL [Anaerobiospirillum sp. NML120449]|uniref:cell division protein FtsL n=1 Tax=Anaerobiospirillum sp. NML120449 TaxID=2932817 RepID=UPI001FF55B39|nr:cell division protein FtsL [Anaerobiospirillum sp. NML120449]MCK0526313.1 cell division protein FtsL [Anaerobiospirillum sp. NML120449]
MFSFTPKNRNNDSLDNSEMLSSLGSSVDSEQLNTAFMQLAADPEDSPRQPGSGVTSLPASLTGPALNISSFAPSGDTHLANPAAAAAAAGAMLAERPGSMAAMAAMYSPEVMVALSANADEARRALMGMNTMSDLDISPSGLMGTMPGMDAIGLNEPPSLIAPQRSAQALSFNEADADSLPGAAVMKEADSALADPVDDDDDLLTGADSDYKKGSSSDPDGGFSLEVEHLKAGDGTGPERVILDEESARLEAMSQKRTSAQVNDIIALKEEKKSLGSLSLVRQNLNLIDVRKDEDNILADEDEELGKIEAEDFITGNVTVLSHNLMTGTDNAAVVSGAVMDEDPDSENRDGKSVTSVELTSGFQRFSSTLSVGHKVRKSKDDRLLPVLLRDFGVNWLTYGLAITVCVLCLLKVYQVQDTRYLTAKLNEVSLSNADLEKQWLNLVASRQNLSEHSKIRTFASDTLKMVSPKTENEQVISLHK